MAKIISTETSEEIEVEDNSAMKSGCMKLGIPFSCSKGTCGTCMVKIVEGKENLEEMNDAEKQMGLDGEYRLSCQCRIKSGVVKIGY